jgi:hypothetical protein
MLESYQSANGTGLTAVKQSLILRRFDLRVASSGAGDSYPVTPQAPDRCVESETLYNLIPLVSNQRPAK